MAKKKTTVYDINKPDCERREFQVTRTGMERPSSKTVYFDCPFCFTEVKAYVWSLCGGMKRCTCGALFGSSGAAYKLKGETDGKDQR